MEVIIPPRDHAATTYRYTWDENGEVERVERVSESVDYTSSRQTVQWPFQDHSRSDSHTPTSYTASFPRRATWQPNLAGEPSPAETIEKDLVPDYVINFMRGETPETLALKKALNQTHGPQDLDITEARRHRHSRQADFYLSASGSSDGHSRSASGNNDLERMLPQSERRRGGPSRFKRLTTGWRGGIAVNSTISFLILILTIICLTVALGKAQMFGGEETIFNGTCAQASRVSFGLHALINVVVVALIAIGNYAFQVLSSPTRREVAVMHDLKRWMDIGIPSVRNLSAISGTRVLLIIAILLAALSTQVIYNAVIFTTRTGVPYDTVLVTQSFLSGAPFSNATSNNDGQLSRHNILTLQDQASRDQLVNMTMIQCMSTFGGAFETGFSAVVLVTDAISPSSSLLQTGIPGTSLSDYVTQDASGTAVTADGSTVQYCLGLLADAADATCSVTLSGSLLGIVALLNLVSVIAVAAVIAAMPSSPLITLGDAIASFLAEPDHSTRGTCLLNKADVWQHRWGFHEAKYWVPQSHYWLQTPSFPRWIVWILTWITPMALASTALAYSAHNNPSGSLSAFGEASPQTVYLFPVGTSCAGIALITALPQLLLFVLYLTTNALVSTYYLSHELSEFALPGTARGLRVSGSEPRGAQVASLFLTIPRPVSWLLLVLFATLGFLLSQAVIVVSVDFVPDSSSSATTPSPISALGFSGVALLAFLIVMVVLAAFILGLGLKRADPSPTLVNGGPGGNPLVLKGGSCSAVLSARCHRVSGDRSSPRRTLAWGVVLEGTGMNVGHATFSSRAVGILNIGRSYA